MRALIVTTIVALALPAFASADIQSHTSASSQTGGNTVGPGGVVSTGATSASVSTSNVSGSSTSSIYIKTNANGEVHEETYTSTSSNVEVRVQATPKATTVDIKDEANGKVIEQRVIPAADVSTEPGASTSVAVAEPASTTPVKEELTLGASIVLAVQTFFASILNWFI